MKDVITQKILQIIILFLFISCTSVFAQSPQEIFQEANLRYEGEDYEQAVSLYEMLVKMDRVSPEVFYNLGNSYFKLGRLGKSIVNYARSLHLAPRDRDARFNLKLARSMVVDKIELPEKGFILEIVLFLYDRMNITELTVLVSVFYLVIIALLVFSIFFVAKRKYLFYTAGTIGILLAVFTVFLASKIYSENFIKRGVVISQKVDVRSGPKEDYILQFTLHEGTACRVVKKRQGWYEIELSKDLRGWLHEDSVELI